MEKPFFVMYYSRDRSVLHPMLGENDVTAHFETAEQARIAAEDCILCQANGYGIFHPDSILPD